MQIRGWVECVKIRRKKRSITEFYKLALNVMKSAERFLVMYNIKSALKPFNVICVGKCMLLKVCSPITILINSVCVPNILFKLVLVLFSIKSIV